MYGRDAPHPGTVLRFYMLAGYLALCSIHHNSVFLLLLHCVPMHMSRGPLISHDRTGTTSNQCCFASNARHVISPWCTRKWVLLCWFEFPYQPLTVASAQYNIFHYTNMEKHANKNVRVLRPIFFCALLLLYPRETVARLGFRTDRMLLAPSEKMHDSSIICST